MSILSKAVTLPSNLNSMHDLGQAQAKTLLHTPIGTALAIYGGLSGLGALSGGGMAGLRLGLSQATGIGGVAGQDAGLLGSSGSAMTGTVPTLYSGTVPLATTATGAIPSATPALTGANPSLLHTFLSGTSKRLLGVDATHLGTQDALTALTTGKVGNFSLSGSPRQTTANMLTTAGALGASNALLQALGIDVPGALGNTGTIPGSGMQEGALNAAQQETTTYRPEVLAALQDIVKNPMTTGALAGERAAEAGDWNNLQNTMDKVGGAMNSRGLEGSSIANRLTGGAVGQYGNTMMDAQTKLISDAETRKLQAMEALLSAVPSNTAMAGEWGNVADRNATLIANLIQGLVAYQNRPRTTTTTTTAPVTPVASPSVTPIATPNTPQTAVTYPDSTIPSGTDNPDYGMGAAAIGPSLDVPTNMTPAEAWQWKAVQPELWSTPFHATTDLNSAEKTPDGTSYYTTNGHAFAISPFYIAGQLGISGEWMANPNNYQQLLSEPQYQQMHDQLLQQFLSANAGSVGTVGIPG